MAINETSRTEAVIPLIEEIAEIDIRKRVTGRTRVTTRTETVTEDVDARVESQDVTFTRVPVGRDLDPGEPVPSVREEGETTIIPVFEEVLIVEKRLRLVEEVHIRRTLDVEDVHVPVTLRRQVAEVEHDGAADSETKPETP